MAAEDKVLQNFLFKKVGPYFVIVCCIYYFRKFFKHHTYDRIYAWVLNGIERRVNIALKMEKQEVFAQLSKLKTRLNRNISVLEIGAGSAPNLHLFPEDTEVVCLEPNTHFNQYIEANLKKSSTKVTEVTVIQGFAEKMPIEDEKFDAVVCTLVLCSVDDQTKSLSEVKRVLKPVSSSPHRRDQDNSPTRQLTDTVFETIHRQILRQLTDAL